MGEEESIRTAIILGAGASSADGASMKLLDAYLDLQPTRNPIIQELEERRPRVRSILEQLFPGNSIPQFEELLSVIELAIQRRETFRGYGGELSLFVENRDERDLRLAHEDLVLSIAEVLARKIGRNQYHKMFVQTLHDNGDLNNVVFLTTNYDILLDNSLTHILSPSIRNITIPNYGMNYEVDWVGQFCRSRIPLFKLHGSLNWLYCPRCIKIDLKPYSKSGYMPSYQTVPCSCGQNRLPVIIPPTPLKDINNPYLLQVWTSAEQELKSVDRFVFCGYSLPQADLQVKYLLKRAQINRENGRQPIEVFVMNNQFKKRKIDSWMREQFENFFGEDNVTCLPRSFQNFAKKGLRILQ
ncbi:MAG: hypothetical protein ACFFFC_10805 [Candidatus Thorarchaeota archaeon]